MKPAGIAVAFAGYTLAYFGWASTRGPGTGLLDLLIPGRVVVLFGSPVFTTGGVNVTPSGPLSPAQRQAIGRSRVGGP